MKHPTFTLLLFCFFIYLSANSYAQRDSLAQKRKADSLSVVFELNKEAEFQAKAPMREAFLRKLANYPSDTVFELNIYNMAFRVLPDLSRFTHITRINAMENQLKEIVLKSKNIKFLESLDVRDNELSILKIGKAPKLSSVFMGRNPITDIPFGLHRARTLKKLDVSYTKIEKLPWWMKYKRSLSELLLFRNEIDLSRKNIRRMRHIKTLQLAGIQIDSLPDYFAKLKKLERLTVAYCRLQNLPDNFYKLEHLEVLILYQNNFLEIPKVVYALPVLRHLDFYFNQIRSIPKGLSRMDSLQELYLSFNQITVLPAEIAELKSLKKLYIHHNNIETAPAWLSKLSHIEVLDMGYNEIEVLPDFSSLDSLREVDFQENKLAKFPFQLLELPKIKLIFLSNNPFDLDKSEQLKLARLSKIYAQGGGRLVLFKKDD